MSIIDIFEVLKQKFYLILFESGFKFAEMEMSMYIHRLPLPIVTNSLITEIVLFTLLPVLKFSLVPGKEIEWNMANIITLVVKGENAIEPKLPLKVELV